MGTNYYLVKNKPSIDNCLHIGNHLLVGDFYFINQQFGKLINH